MSSKTYKFRGTRTHGRGRKSGRGAGKMGGRGNAGLHKHKYISTLKYAPDHFGRRGFKRHVNKQVSTVNIEDLNYRMDKFIKDGYAKHSSGVFDINLEAAGYTKLLGTGTPAGKFSIIVSSASKGAIEKIKSAGGEVITNVIESIPTPATGKSHE
jgi:large subunit ribosomal protein L15